MDKEMQPFQDDLMEAVRDMKAGRAARTHRVPLTPEADARAHAGLSQSQFAALLGVTRLGKPEPLKHEFSGYWSRRITDKHRRVY